MVTCMPISGTKKQKDVSLCIRNGKRSFDSCDNEGMMWGPLVLIFLSQFISGIGVVLFFTLGGPYLDDNTKRKNIPIYFGTNNRVRRHSRGLCYRVTQECLPLNRYYDELETYWPHNWLCYCLWSSKALREPFTDS